MRKRSDIIFGIVQLITDACAIFGAFVVSYFVRVKTTEYLPLESIMPLREYVLIAIFAVPIWLVIFGVLGLYNMKNLRRGMGGVHMMFIGISTGTMFLVASIFLYKDFSITRLTVVYIWLIALFFITFERYILRKIKISFWKRGKGAKRAIIVGSGTMAKAIAHKISIKPSLGIKLIGLICDHSSNELEEDKVSILGNLDEINKVIEEHKPDEIILAYNASNQAIYDLAMAASSAGADFKYVPNTHALLSTYVIQEELAGIPVFHLKDSPLFGWGRVSKRMVDILGSSVALILLSIPMCVVSLLIKATSKGPVLYRQKRVNHLGEFNFLKFRSMREDAEEMQKSLEKFNEATGPIFKIKNDPRITPIGRFLRKYSIDELPQFFNVLAGQMSLVGPRPPIPSEVSKYEPWHRKRLNIKPGLTGMWQVSGRSELSFDDMVKLDIYYIENWSLWLDIKILLKTVITVVRAKGAY